MKALHWIGRREGLASWLVKEAVHVCSQGVEGTLAAIRLDGLVKRHAGLDWDVGVAEKDEVAHQAARAKLGGCSLLGNELGEECLAVVIEVVRVEVVEGFTCHRRLVDQTLATLQHVVQLKADVIDLRKPLGGHDFREHPGITTGLGEVEDHVLDERSAEHVIVLVRRTLVEELVVLACRATAVKAIPLVLQSCLQLGVVVLALRVFDGRGQVVVVEVVLLHESLPVLVRIQPL
mmetsp:Transcript_87381/g.157410  ORF Transcript_87381/g.157410 Transcript_87381/m.157410 type:complete len:234 (+) Transcript_87381:508-1209(+)